MLLVSVMKAILCYKWSAMRIRSIDGTIFEFEHKNSLHFPGEPTKSLVRTHETEMWEKPFTSKMSSSSAAAAAAQRYNIHVLIYGRNLHERRFKLLQGEGSSSPPANVQLQQYHPSSLINGSSHVLVVDGKFIQGGIGSSSSSTGTAIDNLPKEVRSAVTRVITAGGRLCTDKWLERFKADGWTEHGLVREDLTDIYRCQLLGLSNTNASDGLNKKGGGRSKDDVIDLLSDDDDNNDEKKADDSSDDDEIVVVSVKPGTKKRLKTEVDGNKPKRLTEREQERANRIRNRHVTRGHTFGATWLQGVDGIKEAKVKANNLNVKYPKGESPEEIVLARANKYMDQVKRKSNKRWNFVFEECYNEQCRVERANTASGSDFAAPAEAAAASAAASAADAENQQSEPSEFAAVRERNHAIGRRLRDIFAAETALDEFKRIRTNSSLDKKEQARRDFREMQYKRIARTVETYPIRVTLDCLQFPPPWPEVPSRGALCERWGVPKIKCKEGSSTRSRLIRAIVYYDNPNDFRLSMDLDNKKTSHIKDEANLIDPDYKAINELRQIWGVGLATASRFCHWGVFSVQDLRKDEEVFNYLNAQQKVGLARYEDLCERIPRDEVTALTEHVTAVVKKLSNGTVTVTAGGSYRRGASSSGDVDMILLPAERAPDKAAVDVMEAVLNELRKHKFLTDDLAVPNQFGENNGTNPGTDSRSYMGVCRLQDRPERKYRRIDIKAYPGCQGPFSLIYFTGDTHFNRSLRYYAKKAGLTLSDAGLSACVRRKTAQGWKRERTGPSVRCRTEEDVFKALGINYVAPTFRACHNLDKMRVRGNKRWDESQVSPGDDESDYDDSDLE